MRLSRSCHPRLGWLGRGFLLPALMTAALLTVAASGLRAQEVDPMDPTSYDLLLRLDKAEYSPGDALVATAALTIRVQAIQGWSYGLRHDPAVMSLDSIDFDSTDAATLNPQFNRTTIIADGDTNIGFIQAVVLSLTGEDIQLPVSDLYSVAKPNYTVLATACDGASGDIQSDLTYVSDLAVPGSPPVDINVTVAGRSVTPAVQETATATVKCGIGPVAGLELSFTPESCDLAADLATTAAVQVWVASTGSSTDVQGWSYGIAADATKVAGTAGEPGSDAALMNGGNGPEFVNYELAATSDSSSETGVTVGVVLSVSDPGSAVLTVGDGETKHLDTISFRSAVSIPEGGTPDSTTLSFTNGLGDVAGRDPVEALFVVGGNEVAPTATSTKTVNLVPAGAPLPLFIRGDTNADGRVDISDGIWILGSLFYGTEQTACGPAADANNDGSVNMADAMHVIYWRVQPGATPGNLFPAPAAPFPSCGTAEGVTLEDCPVGSTSCN